jgi:CHAT domain-containing protein/tetratricopeptide (TPR) repeat protein
MPIPLRRRLARPLPALLLLLSSPLQAWAQAVPNAPAPAQTPSRPAAPSQPSAIPPELTRLDREASEASERGDFSEAARLQWALLRWLEEHPGPDPAVGARLRAYGLTRLGLVLASAGEPEEAETALAEAAALWRRQPPQDLSVQQSLSVVLTLQAESLRALGRPQEARAPLREVGKLLEERVKRLDPNALQILACVMVVASTVDSELGQKVGAWRSAGVALQVMDHLLKQSSTGDVNRSGLEEMSVTVLLKLPMVLGDLGDHTQAVELARAVVQFSRQRARQPSTPPEDLAIALTNLGQALARSAEDTFQTNPTEAWARLHEALRTTQEANSLWRALARTDLEQRASLLVSLRNLGMLLAADGQRQEAQTAGEEAVELARAMVRDSPRHRPDLAAALISLGAIQLQLDHPRRAVSHAQEGVTLYRELARSNAAYQLAMTSGLGVLAAADLVQGQISGALPLLREGLEIEIPVLQAQLALLPEGRRLALTASTFATGWQVPFSLAGQGEEADRLALFTRLNRQGLLQDIQRSQALLGRSEATRPLARRLAALTTRLASTALNPRQRDDLEREKEALELELYSRLPALRPRLVEPQELARLLPPKGLLLEFQRFQPFDPRQPRGRQFGSPRYLALLLHPDGRIVSVPLGDAAAIDAGITKAHAASAAGFADAPDLWGQVSRQLLAPLQSQLNGVTELFLSPDGELNRVPFAAIPSPSDSSRLLGEVIPLRLLTTGRDLLWLQRPIRPGGPPVLMADPDFDQGKGTAARPAVLSAPQRRSAAQGTSHIWAALPGTASEARLLAPLLQVQPITGRNATARLALQQRGPLIFHIATHGFFQADQPSGGENPLLRSGLVFSGANRPEADPGDDGYLTAAEAVAMDLEGTELVTLSACETGLGDVHSGEGVYGLQRALTVAGSRSTLLSLWKVQDDLTARFMRSFYGRLRRGEGRAEALQNTQREFRSDRDERLNDLSVWGAFQLTGDWRAISGW